MNVIESKCKDNKLAELKAGVLVSERSTETSIKGSTETSFEGRAKTSNEGITAASIEGSMQKSLLWKFTNCKLPAANFFFWTIGFIHMVLFMFR